MPSAAGRDPSLKKVRRRRQRSWVWLLAVVPLLAFAGLLVLAGSPAGNRWLLLRGIDAADMALPNANLEVGELETDVLRDIVLRDVRLEDAEGNALVELASVEIRWQPVHLLRGEILVEHLVLRRPQVRAAVDLEGRVDLLEALGVGGEEEPSTEPWEGLPLRLRVERIRFLEGDVALAMASAEAETTHWLLDDLDLAAGLGMKGRQLSVDRAVLATNLGQQVGEGEPHWLPLGLSGDVSLVDVHEGGLVQNLLLDDLRLRAGSAVIGVSGRVERLGEAPNLDVELALRDLVPAELSFLTGDLGVAGPFGLELRATGPPDALEVQGRVGLPEDSGAIRLGLGTNLVAETPLWNLQLAFDRAEPHRFVEVLSEPIFLRGALMARGEGLSWPDGLDAELGLALEPGVAWGVPFQGLSAKAGVRDGLVEVEQLACAGPLGRASIQGTVDPAGPEVRASFQLGEVTLARMASLGVSDLLGVADAQGQARVVVGDDGVTVSVNGNLQAAGVGYAGQVRVSRLTSPVSLAWGAGGIEVRGEIDARGVSSHGATAAALQGPWRVAVPPDGGVEWQAEPTATGLSYGVVEVQQLRAAVEGGVPAEGPLGLDVSFDASSLAAPSSIAPELRADRAAGQLQVDGDLLTLVAQAKDGERSVLQTQLAMDLAAGTIEVPVLLLAPTAETGWVAVEPVRVTLVEGGLKGLHLRLRSDTAQLWALGDFEPSGPVDLRVMASDFTLDPLVPIFPGLPRGLKGKTRLAVQVSGSADSLGIDGSVEVEGLALPGSLRSLDARLVLHGTGSELAFQLDLPEPLVLASSTELPTKDVEDAAAVRHVSTNLLRATGRLPLSLAVEDVSFDLRAPWDLEVLLAPGEIERFGRIFDVGGLPDGRASAHLRLWGTPAASLLDLAAAVEGPLGEDQQNIRLDVDLGQSDGRAEIEVVVSQRMQRQAELRVRAASRLPELIHQQAAALFAAEPPPGGDMLPLDDPRSWVDQLEASFVPLGVSTDVVRRLVALPEGVHGDVMGGVQLLGDPLHPQVMGAVQLVDGGLGEVGLAPAFVALIPEDGGYGVDLNLGFEGGGSLLASGFVPLDLDLEDTDVLLDSLDEEGLDIEIGGDGIPLAALADLAGDVEEATGMVHLEGSLTGSVLAPEPVLRTWIDDGSMTWHDLAVRYEDIRLEASIIGELARLERLHARSFPAYGLTTGNIVKSDKIGGSTLDLNGSVLLNGWTPDAITLRGQADRFWLIDTNRWRLRTSAELSASGHWPELELRGNVEVSEARIVLDDTTWLYSGTLELDPTIRVHRGATAVEEEVVEGDPWYDALDVQLDLDLSRAATVQLEMPFDDTFGAIYASLASILIETRLDGLLDVAFAGGEISVVGAVEPVVGRADILGARFSLGEGIISFVGDDPFDPILNMEAVHDAGGYGQVAVDITGSLSEMGLAFRSEEYPDETDIVSILITGAPANAGGGGDRSAVDLAVGVLLGELERQSGGGRVVDTLEFGDLGDGGGMSFSAGRALGDDVFLTVGYDGAAEVDEGENKTEVIVDWTITRAWSAEFVTGDQGASSGDLYWTWRF